MSRRRWDFLKSVPPQAQNKLDAIAQEVLDTHGKFAFPSAIRYPIEDIRGNLHWTLESLLESDYWAYRQAHSRLHKGTTCEGCGSVQDTNLYHLHYGEMGHEGNADVIVLCHLCRDYYKQQLRVGRRYGGQVQELKSWLWIPKGHKSKKNLDTRAIKPTTPNPVVLHTSFLDKPTITANKKSGVVFRGETIVQIYDIEGGELL